MLRTASRWVLTAAGLAVAGPVAAQTEPLTVVMPLHQSVVVVRGAASPPRVVVTGPDGETRADVVADGSSESQGQWTVRLSPGASLSRMVRLAPGDAVMVTDGDRQRQVTVPEMTATYDKATGRVTGKAPGAQALVLIPRVSIDWFPDRQAPPQRTLTLGPGGTYTIEPDPYFRPGTWGDVAAVLPGSDVALVSFAPPAVMVNSNLALAMVLADAGSTVSLSVRGPAGGLHYESGPAFEVGSALHLVTFFDIDAPEAGVFRPQPGEVVELSVDGQPVVEAPLQPAGLVYWQHDGRVAVLGPPRASARVTWATEAADLILDGAGSGELVSEEAVSSSGLQARIVDAGPLAYWVVGHASHQTLSLYGGALHGRAAGWGTLGVTHVDSTGRTRERTLSLGPQGEFQVELVSADGEPALLVPGDRIELAPEWGWPTSLVVPDISALANAGLTAVAGRAPPGAAVQAHLYPPDGEGVGLPYERQHVTVATSADTGGVYRVDCPPSDGQCAAYGLVVATTDSVTATLAFQARPQWFVEVERAEFSVNATAGATVSVLATLGDGTTLRSQGRVPAGSGGRLPTWYADLGSGHASGLFEGDDLELTADADTRRLSIPAFEFEVDTLGNRVTGRGPPFHPVLAVAFAVMGEAVRAPYAYAWATATASGHWTAEFEAFDLRPGDDLAVYLGYADVALSWTRRGIDGPEPPSRSGRLFLPVAEH